MRKIDIAFTNNLPQSDDIFFTNNETKFTVSSKQDLKEMPLLYISRKYLGGRENTVPFRDTDLQKEHLSEGASFMYFKYNEVKENILMTVTIY